MSIIDSPIAPCEVVHEIVLLDETQAECAREHGCPPGTACPLADCFAKVSGLSDEDADAIGAMRARRKKKVS